MSRPAHIRVVRRGDLFDVVFKMRDGLIWPGAESQKSFISANEATEYLIKLLTGSNLELEFADGEAEVSWTDLATGKRPPTKVISPPAVAEKKEEEPKKA